MQKKKLVQKNILAPDGLIVTNYHLQIQQKANNREHLFEDFELSFNVMKERQVSINLSTSMSPQRQIASSSMIQAQQKISPKIREQLSHSIDQIDQVYDSPRKELQPVSPLLIKQVNSMKSKKYESPPPRKQLNRIFTGLNQLQQSFNGMLKQQKQISFNRIKQKYLFKKGSVDQSLQQSEQYNDKIDKKTFQCNEIKANISLQANSEKLHRMQELARQFYKTQIKTRVLNAWKRQTLISLSQQKVSNFLNDLEQKKIKIKERDNVILKSPHQKSRTLGNFDVRSQIHKVYKGPVSPKVMKENITKVVGIQKLTQQRPSNSPKQLINVIEIIPQLQYNKYRMLSKYFRTLKSQVQMKRRKLNNFLKFKQIRLFRRVLNSWFGMIEVQLQSQIIKKKLADKQYQKTSMRIFFIRWASKCQPCQITTRSDKVKSSVSKNISTHTTTTSRLIKSQSQSKQKRYTHLLKPTRLKINLLSHHSFFRN